jgi:lysyl-tRNA synthetase class 2
VDAASALRARSRLYATVRAFFDERGFVEVETPLRVRSPGMELHLAPFPAGAGRWLITSPEYHLKRALATGLPRIYEIAKCFRDGEMGAHHHAEFTMLEWYRRDADYLDILADTEALLAAAARAFDPRGVVTGRGTEVDCTRGCERLTTQEAFVRFVDVDWREHPVRDDFARAVERAGLGPIPDDDSWDDVFHRVLVTAVEPRLGHERPTALLDYPASQAALARLRPGDACIAERFEVYVHGVELCNAFSELVDAAEQRRRFRAEQSERRALGKPVFDLDERLLAAIATLPPSGGIALGLDRLLMLLTGATTLAEVLPFGYANL